MTEDITDPKWIKASPTKAFFIHMLTRDVPLSRAILDLVDNCVDGARRLRADGDFKGLWARLELSREGFKITDNCGGIPVHVAREYAFRFGRPEDAEETLKSIGQFGVGMKRSFFKLGREFSVQSTTATAKFNIVVDVDVWMSATSDEKTNDWHFRFNELQEDLTNIDPNDIGTKIEIRKLLPSIGENFELENFRNRLIDEISSAHSLSMDRGLSISVNGIPVTHTPQKLLKSDVLVPGFFERSYPREAIDGISGPPVRIKLYAGVSDRELHQGGWYVFCNGRLVLRADQTAMTVWGPTHNMRTYHPDFAYFRGFAYFDSDHASLLPWTTTKTGVDADSVIYKVVQKEMVELTKPVLEFLKQLESERKAREAGDSNAEVLKTAIEGAQIIRAESLETPSVFTAPPPAPPTPGPRLQRIQYSKPADQVELVKQLLKARTITAVGERTFEYFLKFEGETKDVE